MTEKRRSGHRVARALENRRTSAPLEEVAVRGVGHGASWRNPYAGHPAMCLSLSAMTTFDGFLYANDGFHRYSVPLERSHTWAVALSLRHRYLRLWGWASSTQVLSSFSVRWVRGS